MPYSTSRSGCPVFDVSPPPWMRWLLPLVAFMLTSCSVIPQYPESLPALVSADTALEACPSIAGNFADIGNATTPDGRLLGSVSLTQILHPRFPSSEKVDVVVVRGPELDFVEVESIRDGAQVASWRQPKVTKDAYLAKGGQVAAKAYLCQQGFVRLGRRYDFGGAPGLFRRYEFARLSDLASDFLWLRKSVDGSLIVLHTVGDDGLIEIMLPAKIWYRFPPAQATSENAPKPSDIERVK